MLRFLPLRLCEGFEIDCASHVFYIKASEKCECVGGEGGCYCLTLLLSQYLSVFCLGIVRTYVLGRDELLREAIRSMGLLSPFSSGGTDDEKSFGVEQGGIILWDRSDLREKSGSTCLGFVSVAVVRWVDGWMVGGDRSSG